MATRPARSCSTHFHNASRNHHLNRGTETGVRLAEHDRDANLSNLRFADDIILISGSLKHTTTLQDDFTDTPTKTKIICVTISETQKTTW